MNMRWDEQALVATRDDALPGLESTDALVRSVTTPEFSGMVFHEVLARSALNHVPGTSRRMPLSWTINPYRGCQHACVYCFARNTHTYLDMDAGRDFDSQIVVKTNIVEVLSKELRTKSLDVPLVNLGTNTDPYQRAEGKYSLMPGILETLGQARVPISVLTKGTLVRRDLPLMAKIAEHVPVTLALSIAVYDDALQQSIEPGTPTVSARLATVRAARELGIGCDVFLMPVLPYLTDSQAHLEDAIRRAAEAGASRVLYSALHLRPGVKQWFFEWLGREYPELVPRYRGLYRGAYAPPEYRRWLAARIRPLLRSYGVDRSTGWRPPQPALAAKQPKFADHELLDVPDAPTLF